MTRKQKSSRKRMAERSGKHGKQASGGKQAKYKSAITYRGNNS